MAKFLDLPLDLLPVIISHIPNPKSLTRTCLTNKLFYEFAALKLYERISIYSWHKHGKEKVIQLFISLSQHPHVAKHVRRLEIREFPKALQNEDGIDITQIVVVALRNCVNLRSCTWTRDGSLNSEILEALQGADTLQDLEINGHNEGNYDPRILSGFTGLRKLSVIMPSASVVNIMAPWLQLTGNSLRSLTLICKATSIITDKTLEVLAPALQHLDHFYVTGCPKVTHTGIWAVLSSNITGIVGLGLEGLSPRFDMTEFCINCTQNQALRRLRSITLTVHQQVPLANWTRDISALLSPSVPLEAFQIYSTGAFFESPTTDRLWSELVTAHKDRLVRFSVHRMLISLDAIEDICRRCIRLEELFVVVEQHSVKQLSTYLAQAQNLRTLHINYPLEAQTELVIPVMSPTEAIAVVQHCSSTIVQFGCNTRVWQVGREIEVNAEGEPVGVRRCLMRYDSPDIPEAFLVVRT